MTERSISLNGQWQIRPDPDNVGREERWYSTPPADGWLPVSVPSGWQHALGIKDPAVAWYRTRITAPADWLDAGRDVWLRFGSVATDATVWVNGERAGHHVGNWAPFQLRIGAMLRDSKGEAEIVVRVDKVPATPAEWIDGAPVFGGHITKGFHDVLSLQTAGIWDDVRLECTGRIRALPNGVSVIPDAARSRLLLSIELESAAHDAAVECTVLDPDRREVAKQVEIIAPGATSAAMHVEVPSPQLWWPESPTLYRVNVRLLTREGADVHALRVGFRTVTTGGPNNERLLLNGRPIFLSGILDWGHEPQHITPTPTREELRERFTMLKQMGFNCVCLCMWYPPEHFFEVADEMGMLLWQEHPVWKPWMGDELIPAYKEQFVTFFRRDANHASVVLVSGSCEHERFNPKLAEWWWAEAKKRLPDRVHQIQTAFFAWTDPGKTDLWDEHTYESAGRWVRYLDDLQAALKEKASKPFIMGESVLYTSWPDVQALKAAAPANTVGFPWWYPKGLGALAAFEDGIRAQHGDATVQRFRAQGDRYHLLGRKFQMERYRSYPNHAGHVQNHLRDVPPCRCGFQDDLGRWRFTPEQTRPWLGDRVLLLATPEHRRGFTGGASVQCRVGLSNFGSAEFAGTVRVAVHHAARPARAHDVPLPCRQGDIAWREWTLDLPEVAAPTPFRVTASLDGEGVTNEWTIWALPRRSALGVHRLAGLDFVDADDMYPEFEEHAYSSGWGLKVRTWVCPLPNPAKLVPDAAAWRHGTPVPESATVLVAHKLTDAIVTFMERGGRVVHLTSKTVGSCPNQYMSMWGQVPLLLADNHLGSGVNEALIDLLDYDLTRRTVRSVPTGQLGIADRVTPLVRLVWTHDMQERPKLLDSVFAARVGEGMLIVSSLDHTEDAGGWLLDRLVALARDGSPRSLATLGADEVRRWTIETMAR